jgi:hypothetical protein
MYKDKTNSVIRYFIFINTLNKRCNKLIYRVIKKYDVNNF